MVQIPWMKEWQGESHYSLQHDSIGSLFIPSLYRITFFANAIHVDGPYFGLFCHLTGFIIGPQPPKCLLPLDSFFLNPVTSMQDAAHPPCSGCVGKSWPQAWPEMPPRQVCAGCRPMQTAGRNAGGLLSTAPVKLSWKGNCLLPREPLHLTLPQGSILD